MNSYRGPLLFLCNALVIYLMQMLNSTLAWTGFYYYLGGMLVIFGCYYSRLRTVIVVALLSGLFFDATHTMPFGLSMVLWSVAALVAWYLSGQFDPTSGAHFSTMAALLNVPIFLALAIVLGRGQLTELDYWARVGADLLASTLVIIPISFWYHGFQQSLLSLAGAITVEEEKA